MAHGRTRVADIIEKVKGFGAYASTIDVFEDRIVAGASAI